MPLKKKRPFRRAHTRKQLRRTQFACSFATPVVAPGDLQKFFELKQSIHQAIERLDRGEKFTHEQVWAEVQATIRRRLH